MIHGLAICAGGAGLELGLHAALPDYRTVCYVEREAAAVGTLLARMEEGSLDPAPVWDDVTTFDCRLWRSVVHLVSAGFPCQPFSTAGRRKGQQDERWIWPSIARIIGEVAAPLVFLENVPGLLVRGGIDTVVSELEALGYTVERPLLIEAAAVGAAHERERVFLLAYRESGRLGMLRQPPGRRRLSDRSGADLADTDRAQRAGQPGALLRDGAQGRRRPADDRGTVADAEEPRGRRISESNRWPTPANLDGPSTELADDLSVPGAGSGEPGVLRVEARGAEAAPGQWQRDGDTADDRRDDVAIPGRVRLPLPQPGNLRRQGRRLEGGAATELCRPSLPFAPGPNSDLWRDVLVQHPWLRPSIASAEIEPTLCLLADGLADLVGGERTDALRAAGNGVVPLCAAAAFTALVHLAGLCAILEECPVCTR